MVDFIVLSIKLVFMVLGVSYSRGLNIMILYFKHIIQIDDFPLNGTRLVVYIIPTKYYSKLKIKKKKLLAHVFVESLQERQSFVRTERSKYHSNILKRLTKQVRI